MITAGRTVRALDGVSFDIEEGKTFGLVGETGCGKSVTALSVLRLIPFPPGKIMGGEIHFRGRNLLALSEEEIRSIRGKEISMIFQEPMTSLNPVFRIGDQMSEVIRLHQGLDRIPGLDKAERDAGAGPDPRCPEADQAISPSTERGNEAEGHDRHGTLLPSLSPHCR